MAVVGAEYESLNRYLWHTLDRNELALHYQPKIDLQTVAIRRGFYDACRRPTPAEEKPYYCR